MAKTNTIKIGIDASNIKAGGAVNHLLNLVSHWENSNKHKLSKILIWTHSSSNISHILSSNKYIKCIDINLAIKNPLKFLYWKIFGLSKDLKENNCDVLFSPGGIFLGTFRPFIVMAQNLLPFDTYERSQYKYSKNYFRYLALNFFQRYSFKNSSGVVFLSNHSKNIISNNIGENNNENSVVIHHGVDKNYFLHNRKIRSFNSDKIKIKLLYVSIINHYKNHIQLVTAVEKLLFKGYNIELTLVGPAYYPALKKLEKKIKNSSHLSTSIRYVGKVEGASLKKEYENADIFVFASSCETFGMIILEAMAAGLPIACSNISSMKEVVKNNCEYFNPKNPISIYNALEKLINDKSYRTRLSKNAQEEALNFSWSECSDETFKFIASSVKK